MFDPFTLIGLLANYNKFEFQNPYQLRLTDFVNEATIQTIIRSVGIACHVLREGYTDIQEDLPEGWTMANALGMIGLRSLASGAKAKQNPPKPVYDAETAKKMFAKRYARLILCDETVSTDHRQTRRGSRHSSCHLRLCPFQQALLLQPSDSCS